MSEHELDENAKLGSQRGIDSDLVDDLSIIDSEPGTERPDYQDEPDHPDSPEEPDHPEEPDDPDQPDYPENPPEPEEPDFPDPDPQEPVPQQPEPPPTDDRLAQSPSEILADASPDDIAALMNIERTLDSLGALETVLSVAGGITSIRSLPRSVLARLWMVGSLLIRAASARRRIRSAVDRIARERVRNIIMLRIVDLEFDRPRDAARIARWTRMLDAY